MIRPEAAPAIPRLRRARAVPVAVPTGLEARAGLTARAAVVARVAFVARSSFVARSAFVAWAALIAFAGLVAWAAPAAGQVGAQITGQTTARFATPGSERPATGVEADYPRRPVTLVIPYAQGGPTDKVARPLVRELARQLGQDVRLRYEGGEGATRGPRKLLAEGGDEGHVLLLHNIGMASAPTLYRRLGFDPRRDFVPVGLVADAPMMILGRRDLPPRDATELWTYIQRHESTLAVAYGGPGGAGQLCGLMLEAALKVRLIWVPYTGTGPALDDLQRGRADLLCDQTTHALKAIESGSARAYALTADRRLSLLADLPTTAETGQGGVRIVVWHALYAVAGTPTPVIQRLSAALQAAVEAPSFVAAMAQVGVVPATASQATPAALAGQLEREIARWRPMIVRAGQYAD